MTAEQALRQRILELCQEHNIALCDLAQDPDIDSDLIEALIDGTNQNTPIELLDPILDALRINAADFFCCDLFRNLA